MALSPAQRDKAPPFPPNREIREALLASGLPPLAVWWTMSQLLRPLRGDFGARRKRRLFNLAALRMGMVELKDNIATLTADHSRQTGAPLNVDDFFFGPYKDLLVDFGPGDVERAIKELAREGALRQETRSGVAVLKPTRKHNPGSAVRLRNVLEQMKLHLRIRYAAQYDTERTYRM